MPVASSPESPDSKGGVISVTNQVYEQYEHTDSGKNNLDDDREPDRHRGDANLPVDEKEPEFVDARENPVSDSLSEGGVQDEQGLESSDSNVVPPENNPEQFGGDSSTAADHGGTGALGGYGGDDDEDHGIY